MNTTDKKQTLINATKRLTTLFNETKVSDIGMSNKGWAQLTLEGDSRFKHKEISYPKEAEDVRNALEHTNKNLAYLGVKNGYIVITYKSDLEETKPIFDRTPERTNIKDIGILDKGWNKLTLDGVSKFRHKKISYPQEAEDVRRALQFTDKNLAYLGVLNGYIVTTYKTDLEETRPIFEAHTAAQILNTYNPTMNI